MTTPVETWSIVFHSAGAVNHKLTGLIDLSSEVRAVDAISGADDASATRGYSRSRKINESRAGQRLPAPGGATGLAREAVGDVEGEVALSPASSSPRYLCRPFGRQELMDGEAFGYIGAAVL